MPVRGAQLPRNDNEATEEAAAPKACESGEARGEKTRDRQALTRPRVRGLDLARAPLLFHVELLLEHLHAFRLSRALFDICARDFRCGTDIRRANANQAARP